MRLDAWLVLLQRAGTGVSLERAVVSELLGKMVVFSVFLFFGGGRVVMVRL